METTTPTSPFHTPHMYPHSKREFLWAALRASIFIFFAIMWMTDSSPLSWLLRPLALIVVVESILFALVNAAGYLQIKRSTHRRTYKLWYALHIAFVCIALGGLIATKALGAAPSIWGLLIDYPELTAPLVYFLLTIYLWPRLRHTHPNQANQRAIKEGTQDRCAPTPAANPNV